MRTDSRPAIETNRTQGSVGEKELTRLECWSMSSSHGTNQRQAGWNSPGRGVWGQEGMLKQGSKGPAKDRLGYPIRVRRGYI